MGLFSKRKNENKKEEKPKPTAKEKKVSSPAKVKHSKPRILTAEGWKRKVNKLID